ncbi:MAG: DUF192 domain-containing protein [Patescibacteria group bacterium]
MKDPKILLGALIIIAAAIIFLFVKEKNTGLQPQVCVKNICFNVEIAKTYFERGRGLMFRKNLIEKSGMLFVFEHPNLYPFWMKNTLISLDMIWISEDKKVVFIHKNAQPCVSGTICENINPQAPASYVLEINAGEADKEEISIGDSVSFINI